MNCLFNHNCGALVFRTSNFVSYIVNGEKNASNMLRNQLRNSGLKEIFPLVIMT